MKEFFGKKTPRYAILSHTWEENEITYQDMQQPNVEQKAGFSKIEGCCSVAQSARIDWVWIDTCCIDKGSSAELSEAINSMFDWYRAAHICYAYLADVRGDEEEVHLDGEEFVKSRWFTRGWTLQELLAPSVVRFYNFKWQPIGSTDSSGRFDDYYVGELVSEATGINDILEWESASIACKFSWAASRETTRIEDGAYSLLGLFGVNMPPLYGEGNKAFYRLQLEILKESDDETIFAWTNTCTSAPTGGLLATTLSSFASSSDVVRTDDPRMSDRLGVKPFNRPSYYMSNKGFCLTGAPVPGPGLAQLWLSSSRAIVLPLNCIRFNNRLAQENLICLYLARSDLKGLEWTRIFLDRLCTLDAVQQTEGLSHHNHTTASFFIRQSSSIRFRLGHAFDVRLLTVPLSFLAYHYLSYVILQDNCQEAVSQATTASREVRITVQPLSTANYTCAFILESNDASKIAYIVLQRSHQTTVRVLGPYTRDASWSQEHTRKILRHINSMSDAELQTLSPTGLISNNFVMHAHVVESGTNSATSYAGYVIHLAVNPR